MLDFFVGGAAVLSGVMGARSAKAAGRAAAADAARQAELQRAQIQQLRVSSAQQHQDRLEDLTETFKTIDAMAAYAGREDRSVAAIREKQRAAAARDISRLALQTETEADLIEKGASATEARGAAQKKASGYQAAASLLGAGVNAYSLFRS